MLNLVKIRANSGIMGVCVVIGLQSYQIWWNEAR